MDVSRIAAGLLIVLSTVAASLMAARRTVHYFQLESYQFRGYHKTLSRQWDKAFVPDLIVSAAVLAVVLALSAAEALFSPAGTAESRLRTSAS